MYIHQGITRSLISYYLAKEGFNVVIVEKNIIGYGSTSATTALMEYQNNMDLSKLSKLIGENKAKRCYNRKIKKYIKRIMDDVIKRKLKVTSGVVIKGTKWCGKTTTAKEFASSVLDLQSMETMERYKKVAENSVMLLLEGDKPRLIDKWQEIPQIWNTVRTDIDEKK